MLMNYTKGLPSNMQQGLLELKRRLFFVLIGLILFRLGTHIPVPGLNPIRLANYFTQQQNTILGFFNMFSGGALSRLSVFAIGIMPYISASIIIQLFSVTSTKLEQLKKEGESGKRKINQYIRYTTLLIAIVQSFGMAKFLVNQEIALSNNFVFYFSCIITLVTGTTFIMWLGEQITERGVGNGISLIIFAGIASRFPAAVAQIFQQVSEGQMHGLTLIFIIILVFLVTSFVVLVERAQRRIPINYPQRTYGTKVYAPQQSHLPLKINISGVIPPIFASSIILLPTTFLSWFSSGKDIDWLSNVVSLLSPGQGQPLYLMVYSLAIIFFAFFYTALVFNPKETAENLKRSGAFVLGIRPGEQTAHYIDNVMTRLTLAGSLYLVLVCILPELMIYSWHVPFYFGGTSLLIIVVVTMDFIAQVQTHLVSYQYESLIKKSQIKRDSKSGKLKLSR